MNQIEAAEGAEVVPVTPPAARRIAFERLRERSDELELLISGLLAFALLSLPSRLTELWAGNEVHLDGVFYFGLWFAFVVAVGVCYALGFCFAVHIAIRGYWVGLIGLKANFPGGIQWDRLPLMGPVSRSFHHRMIGDLGEVIDRVDRTASVLFAMTMLIALIIAWTGALGLGVLGVCAVVGLLFEDSVRATLFLSAAVGIFGMLLGGCIPLLDKLVARREAVGLRTQGLRRVVDGMLRVYTGGSPQRLFAPVQFTLQSNLENRGFSSVYYVVPLLALLIGFGHIISSFNFSLANRYQVLTTEAVGNGMLSAHYESMRGPADQLLRYPMIPSDQIESRRLRLFIPHRPQIDNARARTACAGLDRGRNLAEGASAARMATDCLASMWTVTLDGQPVKLDDFMPMERRDLGLRGLMGYIDLNGKTAGRHTLRLVWNAGGEGGKAQREREYQIPFWFDPKEG